MSVLVAEKAEKLVLDDREAQRSTSRVTMQFRHFLVAGDVFILVVKKRSGVQPVGSAVPVSLAVNCVGSRLCAHVDMGAAGGALLGIVHRSVDAKFLNGLRCGRRQALADGQIGRRRTLNYLRCGAASAGDAGIVHDAGRSHRTGGLAIEQSAGIDAIQQEGVAGITLAVGPYRLVAQASVGAGAAGQFGIYTGRKNGESGEAARGQRNVINLILFEDVSVRVSTAF